MGFAEGPSATEGGLDPATRSVQGFLPVASRAGNQQLLPEGHFPNTCRPPTAPPCRSHNTHAHVTHHTTHTRTQHTHARAPPELGLAPSLRDSQAGLKRPLASPWWAGYRGGYWSTGQALGHVVAPGSAPPAFGTEARPGGGASLLTGASLHIHLETFELTAGLPTILHNLCLLRRQKWHCL